MNFTALAHTHRALVTVFLLIYVIKTVLLLLNKSEALKSFNDKTKILEMTVSALFLITGGYMLVYLPVWTPFFIVKLVAVTLAIPTAIIGFRKQNKALALGSLLLIVLAYGMAEAHKAKVKKGEEIVQVAAQDGQEVPQGKAIYQAKCQQCHGPEGNLGAGGAKDLQVSQLTPEQVVQIVTAGKSLMPAYQSQLTPEQIQEVSLYVQGLRK